MLFTVSFSAAKQVTNTTNIRVANEQDGTGTEHFRVFRGDVSNSAPYQLIAPTTMYLGFGTATPGFNQHFVSTVDSAAVAVDGYGTIGVNFISRRAEGTPANPTAILFNDKIMVMQGRGYSATGFSTTSRAFMKFFAAKN